jgi:predicted permease
MKKVFRVPSSPNSRDVSREIDLHIDLRAKEFEAAGMDPEAARRAALEAFGDRGEIEVEVGGIHDVTTRRRARHAWLDELRQDLVVGMRGLRRSPSFALVALLTLGIGIGANTAIFGVLRSVLLRPLPYPQSEQLVQVWSDHRALGRAEPEWLTPPDFLDWREQNTTFAALAAYQGWAPDLTGTGDPESLRGLLVTGDFFDLLGAKPVAGRVLTARDDDPGAERAVMLSYAFWQRRFGGDRAIVGRQIMLSGASWTVAGVLAPDFRAPIAARQPDIFAPMRRPPNAPCGRGCIVLRAIGRMKPNVSLAAAQADLARIAARIAEQYPETNARVGAWLIPLHEHITGSSRSALVSLSVAVALVLLIGCVNLANLLLVRGAARSREIGVRAALGAGRWRVIRQLVTENALLAVLGGALGLGLGIVGTRVLGTLVPDTVRAVQEVHVDAAVVLFAIGVTVAAALLFGLVPALKTVQPGLMTSLRSGGRETGRRAQALRSSLVVTQLTFAVVLLIGAGLLLRSFLIMQRVDLGFKTSGVYLTSVRLPPARYESARVRGVIDDLLRRLRANPGVSSAEATDLPPLGGGGDQDITMIPVGSTPPAGQPPSIWYRSVSLGYLQAMQMRVVSGRAFTEDDREGAPLVGIINEEAARRFWPGQNPVGRMFATGSDPRADRVTVIGVVASEHHDGPNEPYKAEVFIPLNQLASRGVTLVLEPRADVAALSNAVRETIHDVDPLIPVQTLEPLAQRAGDAIALPRLYALLVALFAAAALLLAALGVYGVMAHSVAQRQREIGVRLALGASPSVIGRMILNEAGRLAIVGAVLGLAGAAAVGRLLARLLFGVTPYDATTFAAVTGVLAIVTIVAAWLPARRAMTLDPLGAMREE